MTAASLQGSLAQDWQNSAAPTPSFAGFTTGPARRRRGPDRQYPDPEDDLSGDNFAGFSTGPVNAPEDGDSNPDNDFTGDNFFEVLCRFYNIRPDNVAPETTRALSGIELDDSRERPTSRAGTLYAKLDDTPIEITQSSVLADSSPDKPLTPALAYKMAAAAALNPANEVLELSGSQEERAMLLLAAQHFNLKITQASALQISPEVATRVAQQFKAFENEAGLGRSTADPYLQPAAAPAPQPAARQHQHYARQGEPAPAF